MILLFASLFAGVIAMILHELPKAIFYYYYSRKLKVQEDAKENNEKSNPKSKQNLWHLHHYIDPIGLIFCLFIGVGFSKPYYYRIREKKLSCILGTIGFVSLMIQCLVAIVTIRFVLGLNASLIMSSNISFLSEFFIYFMYRYAVLCIGMLLTNLFPLVAFDMGLLVASASPVKFYSIIRGDYLIKMVWLFTALLGIFNVVSEVIFQIFIGV